MGEKVDLRVRLMPALHEQLRAEAKRQDVSLNRLIENLLASGIGFKLTDN